MNIKIYYFSGTGNTAYIAARYKAGLLAGGHQCEISAMEEYTLKGREIDLSEYDLVGIGFPVHAMDAPRIVRDFISLLPISRTKYFLFKTAGDPFMQGGSTRAIRLSLANKGFRLVHEALYHMPANMASRADETKINAITSVAVAKAKQAIEEILAGKKVVLPDSPSLRFVSRMNALEERGCRKGSHLWRSNANCTLCGLCAIQCPTGNITVGEGKLEFGKKCIFCLRCWWNCPRKGIEHPYARIVFLKKPYRLPEL